MLSGELETSLGYMRFCLKDKPPKVKIVSGPKGEMCDRAILVGKDGRALSGFLFLELRKRH